MSTFEIGRFKDIQQFCSDIIAKHPKIIFDSEGFKSLPANALASIIKRDDLQLDESAIWEYTIKWGIAHNPTSPQSVEQWSGDNFETLRVTLQQCLPHIRYFQISGQDIFIKVQPYNKILEPQLWLDILSKNLAPDLPIASTILPARIKLTGNLPDRETNSEKLHSSIIIEEHVAEISSWVDGKNVNYSVTENPYNFKLILRGSKDGFGISTFWNTVHQKQRLVVVFKVKDTDEIIGGYNSIGWDKNLFSAWRKDKDCFLFSLKRKGLKDSIVSRVKDENFAIDNSAGYTIRFGTTDFYTGNPDYGGEIEKFICKQASYEKTIRNSTDEFYIDDYEVFQICEAD